MIAPGAAWAQQATPAPIVDYDHAYVFGDSLSDTGNVFAATGGEIPTSPPYAQGRFSNGPMWDELLIDDLVPLVVDQAASSRSYAAGGARTDNSFDFENLVPPGILAQLTLFRFNLIATDTSVGPNDLVTVWAGANNIFDAFRDISRDPSQYPDQASAEAYLMATSDAAVADMEQAVQSLIRLGARKILVPNLPDLGQIPRFNKNPVRSAQASRASGRFNDGLFAAMEAVSAASQDDGVNIVSMDIESLFRLVQTRPRDFGIENFSDPCINQVSDVDLDTLTVCSPDLAGQNKYIFWDEIHPTNATHQIIAKTALGLLTADQAFETPLAFSETGLIAARALSHDVSQRLNEVRALSPVPGGSPPAPDASTTSANGRFSLFLSGSYGSGDRGASGYVRGLDYDIHTITAGVDARLGETAIAGLAVSHAKSGNRLTDGSKFDVAAWQGTLFATYFDRGFYLDAALAHGWTEFSGYVRPTTLPQIRASGRTDGTYWAASGNAGYVLEAGGLTLGAEGGLRYIDAEIDPFTEEDAPILGLSVGKQEAKSLAALASLQVSVDLRARSWKIVPFARVTYEGELDGRRRGSGRLIDNTANPMFVDDKLLDDDVTQIGAGILASSGNLRFSAIYANRQGVRRHGKDEQFSARLAWSF